MSWVPPEIGDSRILVVGRDPGTQEMKIGRPFVGPAGQLLDECLAAAGLARRDVSITNVVGIQPYGNDFSKHRDEDIERGLRELDEVVRALQPSVIVALGNEAAYATVEGWPSSTGSIRGATGISERRGYPWISRWGIPVVASTHPAAILRFGTNAAIERMLLVGDLRRAKTIRDNPRVIDYPYEIVVVRDGKAAAKAAADIYDCGYASCDIEVLDTRSLLCVGFGVSKHKAYVFTQAAFYDAFELLRSNIPLCFHNGLFDTYFLASRYNVHVGNYADDTIVLFHCLYPELSGRGSKGSKRTHKSLRFLGSVYSFAPWWKDYSNDPGEMYWLNGVDCAVTLEILWELQAEAKELGISEQLYRHELKLMEVSAKLLRRGLRVDEEARVEAIELLKEAKEKTVGELVKTVRPVLEAAREKLSKPHLLWRKRTCGACRGGSKKRLTCGVCSGVGKWEEFEFNPSSPDQVAMLLYEALKLPKRFKDGAVSVSEEKLKDLLGLAGKHRAILDGLLLCAKQQTMLEIYERVKPGPDGRIRTLLSPVGTSTGRMSSSETFLEVSTNLQNLPKKSAKLSGLYEVRNVVVPDPGKVFLEFDLSQAEARVTAAYAGDEVALEAFAAGKDIHKITASMIFGVPVEEVTPEQRTIGKMARHALNYGMGPVEFRSKVNKDADITGVSLTAKEAAEIVKAYRDGNAALVRWWNEVERKVLRDGYLVNAYGRKHIFLERNTANRSAWIAFLPQSTIADHLNIGLAKVVEAEEELEVEVLLQIHDSILVQTSLKGVVEKVEKIRRLLDFPCVINGTDVRIPVDAAISHHSWGKTAKIG